MLYSKEKVNCSQDNSIDVFVSLMQTSHLYRQQLSLRFSLRFGLLLRTIQILQDERRESSVMYVSTHSAKKEHKTALYYGYR